MLPYTGSDFYVVMAVSLAFLIICKFITGGRYYRECLLIMNASFLLVFYPSPFLFFAFVVYSYITTWFFTKKIRLPHKIYGIIALLLPMLLVKLDIRIASYPFEINSFLSFAGLSYASFRTMGLFMDSDPNKQIPDFFSYFNFLAFTPTILIGPIDRFHVFKNSQDNAFASINYEKYISGWQQFLKGVGFKFVLAEIIDRYWLNLYPVSSNEIFGMVNNMYAYYFYLFFDFAGYSFMALGLGRMMGLEVPLNFSNPFTAFNPPEFWRRFHISLGNWLKDYFFTPLFLWLNRFKSLKKFPLSKQTIALVSTFMLMGCWNGFKLNFILSGLLFGLYSAVHNWYSFLCRKNNRDVIFGNMNPKIVRVLSIIIMFNLAAFSLYIFSGRCPFI